MIELEDVKRLNVQEGDTIVVNLAYHAPRSVVRRIRETFLETFPTAKILILDKGVEIEVLTDG